MFRRVPLSMLSEGLVLASAIFDDDMRLLLGAGIPITQDLIIGLTVRSVQTVVVAEKDWVRLTAFKSSGKSAKALPARQAAASNYENTASRDLDKSLGKFTTEVKASDDPFNKNMKSPGVVHYEREHMDA